MKTFNPTARSGELVLPPMLQESRRSYLLSSEGRVLIETIKLWRPRKSHQQVKVLFGYALKIIKTEFDDRGLDTSFLFKDVEPTGIGVTIDLLKIYFYSRCPIFSDTGTAITLSHEDCTSEKASKFLTDIMAWAASQWLIYIPDPDPNWKDNRVL